MSHLRKFACAVCLLPLADIAAAQSGAPVDPASLSPIDRMNMAVFSHVFETLDGYKGMIEPTDILRLAIIAKQRAVSLTCEGYTVDETRFTAAITEAIGSLASTPESEGEALTLPFMIAYSGYATLLGGNLAVAACDPDAICAEGEVLREELSQDGGETVLIWADAD